MPSRSTIINALKSGLLYVPYQPMTDAVEMYGVEPQCNWQMHDDCIKYRAHHNVSSFIKACQSFYVFQVDDLTCADIVKNDDPEISYYADGIIEEFTYHFNEPVRSKECSWRENVAFWWQAIKQEKDDIKKEHALAFLRIAAKNGAPKINGKMEFF